MSMNVSVYSLKNILFKDEAKSVSCMTSFGEITILDNHEPLITDIKVGMIKITDKNGKEKYIQVKSGFVEVRSDKEVRCMVEEG